MDKNDFFGMIQKAKATPPSSRWCGTYNAEPPQPLGKLSWAQMRTFNSGMLAQRFGGKVARATSNENARRPRTSSAASSASANRGRRSICDAYDESVRKSIRIETHNPFDAPDLPRCPSWSLGVKSKSKDRLLNSAGYRCVDGSFKNLSHFQSSPSFSIAGKLAGRGFVRKSVNDDNDMVGLSPQDWGLESRGPTFGIRHMHLKERRRAPSPDTYDVARAMKYSSRMPSTRSHEFGAKRPDDIASRHFATPGSNTYVIPSTIGSGPSPAYSFGVRHSPGTPTYSDVGPGVVNEDFLSKYGRAPDFSFGPPKHK